MILSFLIKLKKIPISNTILNKIMQINYIFLISKCVSVRFLSFFVIYLFDVYMNNLNISVSQINCVPSQKQKPYEIILNLGEHLGLERETAITSFETLGVITAVACTGYGCYKIYNFLNKPIPPVQPKVEPKVEPIVQPTVQPTVQPVVRPTLNPEDWSIANVSDLSNRSVFPIPIKNKKKYIEKFEQEEIIKDSDISSITNDIRLLNLKFRKRIRKINDKLETATNEVNYLPDNQVFNTIKTSIYKSKIEAIHFRQVLLQDLQNIENKLLNVKTQNLQPISLEDKKCLYNLVKSLQIYSEKVQSYQLLSFIRDEKATTLDSEDDIANHTKHFMNRFNNYISEVVFTSENAYRMPKRSKSFNDLGEIPDTVVIAAPKKALDLTWVYTNNLYTMGKYLIESSDSLSIGGLFAFYKLCSHCLGTSDANTLLENFSTKNQGEVRETMYRLAEYVETELGAGTTWDKKWLKVLNFEQTEAEFVENIKKIIEQAEKEEEEEEKKEN
jgi:hypothetical protein